MRVVLVQESLALHQQPLQVFAERKDDMALALHQSPQLVVLLLERGCLHAHAAFGSKSEWTHGLGLGLGLRDTLCGLELTDKLALRDTTAKTKRPVRWVMGGGRQGWRWTRMRCAGAAEDEPELDGLGLPSDGEGRMEHLA
ncbi:hypothetical protein BCR44DRAFT_1436086 [Catenaria anguillulae PL171]|uniref:Uncharacterized protein n=1 Tax=Catenaria anguillulae PL171 TaxID=765915 RepID=A0A1Y2HJ61_9FUNG|nr:hypothetical protein BCR44DRAFT_1436086 [Catenaria anguillulae PL171]